MKRITILLLLAAATIATYAQSRGDNLRRQAAQHLEAKDYTKARYNYLKAYEALVAEGKLDEAMDCAVNTAALYHRENYYKEAFDVLNVAEAVLTTSEQGAEPRPALHYPIARERQRMYVKLRNQERAADWLARMTAYARDAKSRDIDIDLLSTQAQHYYTFGPVDKGDQAINSLIALYLTDKDYDSAQKCYKSLIDMAVRTSNARLTARSYEKYLAWSDSIARVRSDERSAALTSELEAARADVEKRDSSITAKNVIITGLIVLAAALATALVVAALALMRALARGRRLRRDLEAAHHQNEVKTGFINNIASQMKPTLAALPPSNPAVEALTGFTHHIQQLSELESHRTEPYDTESVNVADFLGSVADEARPWLKPDVTLTVNAPKMPATIAPEPLRRVLLHLLANAAANTPAGGKIALDFKKRGPHNIQFMVTDSGQGVPEELRPTLFTPFARVADLTQGDGLGLPICALQAERMRGRLRLDDDHRQGARFIIELHP